MQEVENETLFGSFCAYVALCRVGCLRNSHIDVESAACSALAQIDLIAKASLNIKIAPLPLRPRWFWVDHRLSGHFIRSARNVCMADNSFAMDRECFMVSSSPNLRGSEGHATAALATGRT